MVLKELKTKLLLKEIKSFCKELSITAGLLKGSLTERQGQQ
jgi:hypothetical protein